MSDARKGGTNGFLTMHPGPLGRGRRPTSRGLRQGRTDTEKQDIPPKNRSDELWSLYVLREYHGTRIGALLLDAVLPLKWPAELWVADANPRARRFYEKHGFTQDGAQVIDELKFVLIRMVR